MINNDELKEVEKFIKLNPSLSLGYLNKANHQIEFENLESAKKTLEETFTLQLDETEEIKKLLNSVSKVIELQNTAQKFFAQNKYKEAIELYSDAIQFNLILHVLYSSRSVANLQMNNFNEALQDANESIKLKPKWSKGYLRQGNAFIGLGNFEEASKSFSKGIQYESDNTQLKKRLEFVKSKKSEKKESGNFMEVSNDQEYANLVKNHQGLIVVDFIFYFMSYSSLQRGVVLAKILLHFSSK
jgi:tetratricopeptide (TPR) repeat protein